VVLAYLLHAQGDGANAALLTLVADATTPEQINVNLDLARLAQERVEDIQTYPLVALPVLNRDTGIFSLATSVCAELFNVENQARRWLLFALRYQRPSLKERTTDRWAIADVVQEPMPTEEPGSDYCQAILARIPPKGSLSR
jgi:hypothetical protein